MDETKAMENSYEHRGIFNSHSHSLVLGQMGLQPLTGRELRSPVGSVPRRKVGSWQGGSRRWDWACGITQFHFDNRE